MEEVLKEINHPYLQKLKDTLSTQKKMLECLEKRLFLIKTGYANKNDYEKNEIEIVEIKTNIEIEAIKRVINEKEFYFVKFMNSFVKDIEEVDKNYDVVLNKAKVQAKNDSNLDTILKSVNWEMVKQNLEVKVHFYKRIKSLIK